MSEPQARPTTALLARKGLAAPVGSPVGAALPQAAPAPESESLPEIAAPTQAAAAPVASLRPLDYLTGQQGARDLAQRPPNSPDPAPDVAPDVAPDAAPDAAVVPAARPAAKPEAKAAATATPALPGNAGALPAAGREPRRFPALAAGLAAALVLGAAGYGYQSGWLAPPAPERPQAPAAPAATPAPTPPKATDTALAPAGAPAGTPAETPAGTPSVTKSDPVSAPDLSSGPDSPSVDVVRIEADGAAVIAGRSAPKAELILLDNGAPIGTVTADAYGEWVFIPANPLPSGAHHFELVIKMVRGSASVPAAGQGPDNEGAATPGVPGRNKPGTVVDAAATVPIPPRKPDVGTKPEVGNRTDSSRADSIGAVGAPSPAFVVQLASLKSRAGAQQEWRTLRERFPKLLSQMPLSLDEAKLAGGTNVVRLRIGAFPEQTEADALCARLAAKNQDCLVVRTTIKR